MLNRREGNKERKMDEAVKKLVLEVLREKLSLELDTTVQYSGDSRYEHLQARVLLDGEEVCMAETLLSIS